MGLLLGYGKDSLLQRTPDERDPVADAEEVEKVGDVEADRLFAQVEPASRRLVRVAVPQMTENFELALGQFHGPPFLTGRAESAIRRLALSVLNRAEKRRAEKDRNARPAKVPHHRFPAHFRSFDPQSPLKSSGSRWRDPADRQLFPQICRSSAAFFSFSRFVSALNFSHAFALAFSALARMRSPSCVWRSGCASYQMHQFLLPGLHVS